MSKINTVYLAYHFLYLEVWIGIVNIGTLLLERLFEGRIGVHLVAIIRQRDTRCYVRQTLAPKQTLTVLSL